MQAVLGPRHSLIDHLVQAGDGGRHIERLVVHRRQDQVAACVQCGAGDVFIARTHHHLVHPAHAGAARLAEAALHPGQVLQFEGDVFEDVPGPGAFAQPLQEAAVLAYAAAMLDQRGQPRAQSLVETGNGVGRGIFQDANVQPDFQNRTVCPDVRAA